MNYQLEGNQIYAKDESGELLVWADVTPAGTGVVDITHVYVSPVLRGQGAGGKLMQAVVEHLRKNSLKAVASCSYASSWLQKNIDSCSDVVAPGFDQMPVACRIDGPH